MDIDRFICRLSGHDGAWRLPLTVFMTPDAKPFYTDLLPKLTGWACRD